MIKAVYLGVYENSLIQASSSRSLEEKIVEYIENNQLIGKIGKSAPEDVTVEVTKHGVKISSKMTNCVKLRIPLLELVLLTTFYDGFGRIHIVLVEKSGTSASSRFQLHLLQAIDENSANLLCKLVKDTFIEAEEASALIEAIEPPSPSLNL